LSVSLDIDGYHVDLPLLANDIGVFISTVQTTRRYANPLTIIITELPREQF
jgi:hypothetical protein